jgi:type I restriction enzyme S subunit
MTEWQTKTVGEIADTQLGKMLNKGRQSGKYAKPYLRTDNVHWGRFDLSEIKEMDILPEEQDKYLATKGDLLMCEGGASGRTAIWNEDYDISFQNHVHRIRPKDPKEITPKYLLYYFEWFIKNGYASDLIKGVTISHLSQSGLRSIEVTYPPIDEQHKIVELLEDHLSRLDAALADVKQARLKAAQFRRSLLQAAFTGNLGLDETNSLTEWRTKTVGEIADTQLGKMLNKGKQTGENTIPYLRSVNVQWGRVDTSDLNQMDILPNELEKFTVKKGDLLICEGGESGRVAIWDRDEPIGFQNALHRVRAKAEVTNKYLYYYFEWLVKNQLNEHLYKCVTIKHFPQENLRSVEVSYPPVDEQDKIVELLEDHLSRLDASVSLADAMQKQSNGLRRSMLQAAFSGQLTNEVVSV